MIGIIIATKMEAKPLLSRLGAERVSYFPFKTYLFAESGKRPGGVIVISKIGVRRAKKATEYLIESRGITEVINYGICGALSNDFGPGSIFRISSTVNGDRIVLGEGAESIGLCGGMWSMLPEARLATVKKPVFNDERRLALSQHAEVVDMEGHSVAAVCAKHGIRCHLLKGVSDLANGTGKKALKKNLAPVSEEMAEIVVKGL